MKKILQVMGILVLGVLVFWAGSQVQARGRSDRAGKNSITVVQTKIVLDSYEFGPGVSKIVLETDKPLSEAVLNSETAVATAGIARQINDAYLSDAQGNRLDRYTKSSHVALELAVDYNTEDPAQSASPFIFDLSTYRNYWVDSYVVKVNGLGLKRSGSGKLQLVNSEQEAIENRLTPSADRFSDRGTSSLPYAAYQPESAAAGEKKPLIVWLHGIGEAGTDLNFPLLSNKVAALTQEEIQSQFTSSGSGEQTGAYVLVPQAPTAWNEQYGEALIETIDAYLANNPDIDSDRIYLAGASNGGAMTLEMGIHYPDYFAALVPIAAPYSYQTAPDNDDSPYSLDEETLSALKDQPMWLIHSQADTTIPASESALPFYKAMIDAGFENKWISYYESAIGTDLPGQVYNGHWAWIYFFNNQVTGVQSRENVASMSGLTGLVATDPTRGGASKATVSGIEYNNIFTWLNAQEK
ncbi:glucan-binding protein [Streptococcus chenjunshii]|uniref:Glucan-binding protein n=1 Tax=Streptococcus chenjunshii TaxID=2173853 RepID=A0A372KQK5_9STRE|nr:PHB depolymerase family esterase [Streptococcus chenjunshii]AXQ78485.1 glucan-binding protein [Streptococcus chenjunshii]RFU52054.1 glucan-binding protein [Streptococcus chenjunshii]RFU54246.1 glucan-binding protein [Streptococcus chenjunshii]